jgi:PAS domain S-box-containing protein
MNSDIVAITTQHSEHRSGLVRRVRQIEGREWWLWGFAVTVTLSLTAAIIFLTYFEGRVHANLEYWSDPRDWARGLVALVLLFNIYTLYQHFLLQRIRKELADRNQLFELITENAADMIAVVDADGKRLYNSPAYYKLLGYTAEELNSGSSLEQVHAADRERVVEAAAKARATGRGQRLEYRMRHKDGSWRILESTANPIQSGDSNERLVIVNRDITERKKAEEMLEHSALFDALTDLPNRALFSDRLGHAVVRARRHYDYKFAVLFVDVDEFKIVNDSLGHAAGDEILKQIAARLTANFRGSDTLARSSGSASQQSRDDLARLGGDEFTILLEDVSSPADAIRVAQRIQAKLATPFEIQGKSIVISTSIGVVCSNNAYDRAEDLLRDAEIAMYRAKRNGKARSELFDPAMHAGAVKRLTMEADLRRAVGAGELVVYYQPIVSLLTNKIVGFEALSRWRRSDGMVSPAEFIPIAEETGLIVQINRTLLLQACQQLRSWQTRFRSDPPLTMSVNVTSKQFALPGLASEVSATLQKAGVDPGTIALEIMETLAMADADRAMHVLSDLKSIGVRVSIDDFGTGYSSLSRLPLFPIDTLKIDRVFIANLDISNESSGIVDLIVKLANGLGLKVIAEGAETQSQLSHLKRLACNMAQGFIYSPPVNAETALQLLEQNCLTATLA